jgi:hypothetical protein
MESSSSRRLSLPNQNHLAGVAGVASNVSNSSLQQPTSAIGGTAAAGGGSSSSLAWTDAPAGAPTSGGSWVPSLGGGSTGGHLGLLLGDSGDLGELSGSVAGMETGGHTPTSASGEYYDMLQSFTTAGTH